VGVVIVEMASSLYAQLRAMGENTKAETRRRFAEGEPIPEGQRHDGIFWHAVDLLQEGVEPAEALERVLEAARTQCVPPYDDKLARKQFRGAAKFVAGHPNADTKARRVLDEHRAGNGGGPRDDSPRADSDWEEPVPIATREAVPALDVGLLPEWLGDYAAAITAEKGAALDLGGNLALGVVSGGIARNVQVSPRPGWYEPTNLYVIVALAPGQAKSPVFKSALRPVRTLERQQMQHWRDHERLVGISGAIFEKRRKDLIAEAASDDELGPERLQEMMGELDAGLGPTEAPPQPRLLTEDVTPEGLASLLAAHGRIIAASDEGSALFENLAGRYARGQLGSLQQGALEHRRCDRPQEQRCRDRLRPGAHTRDRDAAGHAADAR
jgi:hypothetical protein